MQRNLQSLIGCSIEATDGEIEKIQALYFDDKSFAIRFLVVKTGSWLSGISVLISPVALQKTDWDGSGIPVNLTKEQVSNSPRIDMHKPVSRQHEMELYEHYSWQPYWASGFYAGGLWGVMPPAPLFNERIIKDADNTTKTENKNDDLHLRSTDQVTGYHIKASDGETGHVNDFIIDDTTWQILYFVIDTHNWIGGKKVLVAVENIKEIIWEQSKIILTIFTTAVKDSASFDELNYNHPEKAHSTS
ncbi:PRC-barrel domain-containing protein [Ferruginibacter sp.]|uniref:PRC-barrel domain-containing protein n=1 Tax=Ferruginibacter sp. TaxID=1940288 RepID=UPI002657CC29|nr:PRC-barrel domain-containing protein [Ferruginibacter sp.]